MTLTVSSLILKHKTSQVCQIIDSINLFIHLYLTLIDGWQVDMILAKISAAFPENF